MKSKSIGTPYKNAFKILPEIKGIARTVIDISSLNMHTRMHVICDKKCFLKTFGKRFSFKSIGTPLLFSYEASPAENKLSKQECNVLL